MKVLYLLTSKFFSGAESVVCSIIENNKDVESYYCSPSGSICEILKKKKINFIPIDKFNISNLNKIVKDYKIDIIHANDYKASFLASFVKNCKVISHIHCNPSFARSKNIYSIIYLFASKRFNKIIYVSDTAKNDYVFKDKVNNKALTLYNFIDSENILKKSKELKLKNKYDLVFLGRLEKVKNPIEFLEIVKSLKKSIPNIKSAMVGDGSLKNDCLKYISDNKLDNNVSILGFKLNPYPYVLNSKVSVVTSLDEGYSLATIECLILSKPVINSGVGGLKNIFDSNREFIYNNIVDATKKINKLLSDKKFYDKESLVAKNISTKYCDKNSYLKSLNLIYKEAIK